MKKTYLIFLWLIGGITTTFAQLTASENFCINALIKAYTNKDDKIYYFANFDRFTLSKCFDEKVTLSPDQLVAHLEQIKTNDSLRDRFYGMLKYYYAGGEQYLLSSLKVTASKGKENIIITEQPILEDVFNIIKSSSFNYEKIIFTTTDTTGGVIDTAGEMAEFPGGQLEMFNFVTNHFNYPVYEREADIQGTVFVEFIVEKNGKVTSVKAVRKVSPGLDFEAVKLVKLMPDWIPGSKNGVNKRTFFNLPIKFKLE